MIENLESLKEKKNRKEIKWIYLWKLLKVFIGRTILSRDLNF